MNEAYNPKTDKITITVTLKDGFDPTLGSDITEAVQDFEQVLASYFEES